jgi:hypothetical protein
MKAIEIVKNRLIDRMMVSNNEELLNAIESIFRSSQEVDEELTLNSAQNEMLYMSEKDIENGDIISEVDLRIADSSWMY